jgi:hypothetical protein
MNKAISRIVLARRDAAGGIDYTAKSGAPCPYCGERSRSYRTLPWEDTTRIRYHRCENLKCPLATMKITIKSIEADK